MRSKLDLLCSLSSDKFFVKELPNSVYLLLEIEPILTNQTEKIPAGLSFLIDTSDSMHIRLLTNDQFARLVRQGKVSEIMTDGVPAYQVQTNSLELLDDTYKKIDYVSNALSKISAYLRPNDSFSVIAFASHAHCLVSMTSGNDKQRLFQAAQDLECIKLGDMTQMAEGMALAYTQLEQLEAEKYSRRMILLTDGHTNNVKACYQMAEKIQREGIKLSTMGIGSEFNEQLLIPLADLTGGNAYYIQSPDQILQAFLNEIGSALNISCRNLEIKINFPNGSKILKSYKVKPQVSPIEPFVEVRNIRQSDTYTYSLFLGDYDPSEQTALLLEVDFPFVTIGTHPFVQLLLTWEELGAKLLRQNQRVQLQLKLVDDGPTLSNQRVMDLVKMVQLYEFGNEALSTAQKAIRIDNALEKQNATIKLQQAATSLLDMGVHDLGNALSRQAELLINKGYVDPDAVKNLRYETRRITKNV
jgi:Ca-activated chloride channel homolog